MVPWRGQRDLPEADALLFHAHAIVEATTCPACGRPLEECRGPDNAGRFDVETDVCHATAALEAWRSGPGKDAPDGTVPHAALSGERPGGLSQAQLVAAAKSAAGQGGGEGHDADA